MLLRFGVLLVRYEYGTVLVPAKTLRSKRHRRSTYRTGKYLLYRTNRTALYEPMLYPNAAKHGDTALHQQVQLERRSDGASLTVAHLIETTTPYNTQRVFVVAKVHSYRTVPYGS